MQDVLAVMDATGADRPAVCGDLEGCQRVVRRHPSRTHPGPGRCAPDQGSGSDDFPWALAPELQHLFSEQLSTAWGSEPMARTLAGVVAPSLVDDQRFLQFLAKAMREQRPVRVLPRPGCG